MTEFKDHYGGNYPHGCSISDKDAPWNEEADIVRCAVCDLDVDRDDCTETEDYEYICWFCRGRLKEE